ncbi:MAG: DUF6175 family protein [Spirochaetales bacterium]|nr:DUF6175 family protein [Spirochaetales bacterium]MCF7938834.1 DUF6175 family protein [Spirochaetales bacterium]
MRLLIKKLPVFLAAAALIVLVTTGCTSTGAASRGTVPSEPSGGSGEEPAGVYKGSGTSDSLLKALNAAKMDAVQKAVVDLIGSSSEDANHEQLDELIYSSSNPNAFIKKETMETLRKDNLGTIDDPEYVMEIMVEVNTGAVRSVLDANGITGTPGEGGDAAQAALGEGAGTGAAAETSSSASEPTPEEKKVIDRYIDSMTYLVYFNEESEEAPFLLKSAVTIANEYLVSNAMEAVDLGQVEQVKEDQRYVYEEETGQDVSLIQWVAQKLNADVYIELDAATRGESENGNHYGTANVTVKAFEASTGRLMGSQTYNSPRAFSSSSKEDAVINALQSSIYKAMPYVIDQTRGYMEKALANGIKYEVVIQNTTDSRAMSRFRRRLQDEVKEVKTLYQSPEETKLQVYIVGTITDLEDTIYDVSDRVPGFENMYQVMLRGKSITFDTGL